MTNHRALVSLTLLAGLTAGTAAGAQAPEQLIHVPLSYAAPGDGRPAPNFSPKGTQVALSAVAANAKLPAGAVRPAKRGMIKVGLDSSSWIPVLATATAEHPRDLCQLYLDRNRNGDFTDDGPPIAGVPTQNVKTKAWWTSINKIELTVPYAKLKSTEPYLVNFWIVRDDSTPPPDVLRYSVNSWRYGTMLVHGVDALVAAMDGDNNAVFDKEDSWSVLAASDSNAARRVLSIAEARGTSRLMFLPKDGKDLVLEFRSFSPDGRSIDFAVIDKPVTKLVDRAPDDNLRDEYPRPRTTTPFTWGHGTPGLNAALAKAKTTGKMVFLDFEATWCGPCHTMDQWIWNDAEVAGKLNTGFLGVKIDVDLEKALVKRFNTTGYPTMIVLDNTGKEIKRVVEYQSSKQMMAILNSLP